MVVCSSASMTCRGLCRCFCQVQQVKEAERSGVAAQRLLAVTCDASARLTGALRTGSLPQVLDIYPKNHCERRGFLSLLQACPIYWCAASALALGAIIWREWLCDEGVGWSRIHQARSQTMTYMSEFSSLVLAINLFWCKPVFNYRVLAFSTAVPHSILWHFWVPAFCRVV